jgi:hypothetical protein
MSAAADGAERAHVQPPGCVRQHHLMSRRVERSTDGARRGRRGDLSHVVAAAAAAATAAAAAAAAAVCAIGAVVVESERGGAGERGGSESGAASRARPLAGAVVRKGVPARGGPPAQRPATDDDELRLLHGDDGVVGGVDEEGDDALLEWEKHAPIQREELRLDAPHLQF